MKLEWQIRAALPQDSNALQVCMRSAYAMYRQRMEGRRLPPMDVNYSTEIKDFPVWVVESDGRIIGGLIMMFEHDHAVLANIAVHPEFQGLGIGGGLMEFAETKAKQNGHKKIRLATHVLLNENIVLYLHLGWKEVARDDTRVTMQKEL